MRQNAVELHFTINAYKIELKYWLLFSGSMQLLINIGGENILEGRGRPQYVCIPDAARWITLPQEANSGNSQYFFDILSLLIFGNVEF